MRLAAVLALFLALCASCALAESAADPIRVSSQCDPQSVIDEQDVTVTIKVYNSSQTDMTDEITLYGPDGFSVQKYAGLPGEQSVTYTGAWHVTPDQIAEGKINYYIKYFVDTGSGPVSNTRTIPVAIKTEAAAPQLSATYTITPAAAREGQEVTLAYTLSNVGNVELRNIVVSNEGVTKDEIKVSSLSVGERVTQESKIKMGAEALVSNPTVTYEAADSGVQLTISDMARRTITLAEDDLEVAISGENLDALYPGESVDLSITIKNTGETPYNDLTVLYPDGTVAASGIALEAGKSYEDDIRYTASESGKLSVNVTGTNAAGESVGVTSNELDVATQDPSQALILRVRAQARETDVYSEPAVIRFAVVVDNIGEIDATNLDVTEAGVTVATIPSLPAGESRTLVFDLQASIAGQFQFVVSGKDGVGKDRAYESNVLRVTYIEPTPAPTNTPAPTEAPPTPSPEPTATPAPSLADRIAALTASVNPVVLYTAAGLLSGVILLVLIVSGVSGARRKKRMANALDTLQLSPDVRDHRGRRRAKKPRKGEKTAQEPVVPTPDLTEEEAAPRQEPSAPAEPAEEGKRRRAPQEKEVSAERTLRVAPVDQRPEFVAQRKVDDSATRVFNRVKDGEEAPAKPERRAQAPAPVVVAELDKEPAQEAQKEQPAQEIRGAQGGETIRLNNAELSELHRQQEKKNSIKTAKPMKKKKKGLFGRRDEGDDMVDDYDGQSGDDDDLFE